MLTNRTKWYLLIGSILGISCCVFGCLSLASKYLDIANEYNKRYPSEKLPIRTLLIQLDRDQREELIAQLSEFSEKHYFSFNLSFYENKEVFFIEMYGQKLQILAQSIPGAPEKTNIAFFEEDPTNPPSQKSVDELFSDLKMFISEVPHVTVIEEK